MKYLNLKEIILSIVVSYFITAYINMEFNPNNWVIEVRIAQIGLIGISLFFQAMFKDLIKDNNGK